MMQRAQRIDFPVYITDIVYTMHKPFSRLNYFHLCNWCKYQISISIQCLEA